MAKKQLVKDQDKVIVRLPDGMRDLLKEQALKNGRSMNAEIVARLERSFETDREAEDWQKLVAFYEEDQNYITNEYFKGTTDSPKSDARPGKPETDLVKQINRIIASRTEMMGQIVVRELEKKGMLGAPGTSKSSARTPTPEEMDLLHNAPPAALPTVLECLANHDIDGALVAVYKAREKQRA